MDDDRGLFEALTGDGRPWLVLTGLALVLSGTFAVFLSATGQFLPHDVDFLGLNARELCEIQGCRVVHFMFHDRVAFGGTLLAIGFLYLWLAEFPLAGREAWAWWLFLASGIIGFASFLAYLGYGYLDTWHGVATLALLPCFLIGLVRSRALVGRASVRELWSARRPIRWKTRVGAGRVLLLATGGGMLLGGMVILGVGMTRVFVPEDTDYIGLSADELAALNTRLVPLIAHDRAGFGGGLGCCGMLVLGCVAFGRDSRSLWQVLALAGSCGFVTAIGVHFTIGYTELTHLAPAYAGAALFVTGLVLTFPMTRRHHHPRPPDGM